ncbi:hypothetical protein MMC13_000364 [Lambiella insularis]|nr:hypothetical protein [Lambiella insularis]
MSRMDSHASNDKPTSEVVTAKITSLAPSSLPPPSNGSVSLSSPNGESEEDGKEEEDTVAIRRSCAFKGATYHQRNLSICRKYFRTKGTGCGSDDSSIDLLAHARRFDPATVAAQERDFDAKDSPSVPEDVPTGSMAATAGAGTWSAGSDWEDRGSSPVMTPRVIITPADRQRLSTSKRPYDPGGYIDSNAKRLRIHRSHQPRGVR